MHAEEKSVPRLMTELVDSVGRLVRQELALARTESAEKAEAATAGLISVIGGLLIALAALMVLVQAVVVALADHMSDELAALLVGVVLAAVAFVLIRVGQSKLKADNLALPKTQESLKRDRNLVMETVQ